VGDPTSARGADHEAREAEEEPGSFRVRSDRELERLSDEALLAYVRAARDAGELSAARRGLMILVYGHEANVRRRLSLRVGEHVLDDLVREVLVKAIAGAFAGSSVGEFRSWLNTIVERTAADYHRRAKRRPSEAPLPSEHPSDEQVWGEEPRVDGEAEGVELRILVEEVLATFGEKQRRVIELHVLEGRPAREVCESIDGMREDNVAQIASRFRRKLQAALEEAGRGER
jgi:RNA polymerase sigma factor (sigma-70 family)